MVKILQTIVHVALKATQLAMHFGLLWLDPGSDWLIRDARSSVREI